MPIYWECGNNKCLITCGCAHAKTIGLLLFFRCFIHSACLVGQLVLFQTFKAKSPPPLPPKAMTTCCLVLYGEFKICSIPCMPAGGWCAPCPGLFESCDSASDESKGGQQLSYLSNVVGIRIETKVSGPGKGMRIQMDPDPRYRFYKHKIKLLSQQNVQLCFTNIWNDTVIELNKT